MTKSYRQPLLDINGIDFGTGKYNEKAVKEQKELSKEFDKKILTNAKEWIKNAVKENGKIYVEGLGRC